MNDRKRAFRPTADGLEARIAMSAGVAAPNAQAEITTLSAATTPRPVVGILHGRYHSTAHDNRAADEPLQVQINAAGNIRGTGKAMVSGSLTFGGFRAPNQPDVTGTLTLTNAKGSITVKLTGSGGNGPIANHSFGLNASIVAGTGDYANWRGIGHVTAKFGKNTASSATTAGPIGGALTLQFNLAPPVR